MSLNETAAARQNPTLPGEMNRLADLIRDLERIDSATQSIGGRLTGPYPVRGDDATDKEPYGEMQRLQLLVDRLVDRQVRIADSIEHIRNGLFGYEGEGLSSLVGSVDATAGQILGSKQARY